MKTKYYIFTLHPTYKLDEVVDTEEIARQRAEAHRRIYADIPVYIQEVREI